jgi:hypothetical protein
MCRKKPIQSIGRLARTIARCAAERRPGDTQRRNRVAYDFSLVAVVLALGLSACSGQVDQDAAPTPFRTRKPTSTAGVMFAAVAPVPKPTVTPAPVTPSAGCALVTLEPGLHISANGSYTETETEAAGPMVCRIERDSCAYRRLIGNLDPSILFNRHKPLPYDVEDTLMHPAMLLPLTRLRDLVAAEWGSQLKLLVTAAYDSLLEHDLSQADNSRKYSLHFEGRSIDLVTYPVEPARYSRLCALAQCAGFDWVNNEGDHCHASIKAQSLCSTCSGVNDVK